MEFEYITYTEKGNRPKNEDSTGVLRRTNGILAVVADGVGGMKNGELASKAAVEAILSQWKDITFTEDTMEEAVCYANEEVCVIGDDARDAKTTIAVLATEEDKAVAANVGDSRIYQFRENEIVFQSTDHSIPQLEVSAGHIKPEQIRTHKERNVITCCLGTPGPVKMNIRTLDIQSGDVFLLCTDGFWSPVLESDMLYAITQNKSIEDCMTELVRIADSDQSDNQSAILIYCK